MFAHLSASMCAETHTRMGLQVISARDSAIEALTLHSCNLENELEKVRSRIEAYEVCTCKFFMRCMYVLGCVCAHMTGKSCM